LIYETYGRIVRPLTATVIHYRSRRAVREVGKALGLQEECGGVGFLCLGLERGG